MLSRWKNEVAFVKSIRSRKRPLGSRGSSGLTADSNDAVLTLLHTDIRFMSGFMGDSQVLFLPTLCRSDTVDHRRIRELTEIPKGGKVFLGALLLYVSTTSYTWLGFRPHSGSVALSLPSRVFAHLFALRDSYCFFVGAEVIRETRPAD